MIKIQRILMIYFLVFLYACGARVEEHALENPTIIIQIIQNNADHVDTFEKNINQGNYERARQALENWRYDIDRHIETLKQLDVPERFKRSKTDVLSVLHSYRQLIAEDYQQLLDRRKRNNTLPVYLLNKGNVKQTHERMARVFDALATILEQEYNLR
ncbi:hypothetical protein [Sphingobacterium suaedae]|uniref:Gliding motility-associated protein GldM N-terminal domain-containing protein n=1 Tax=Sphingobacterium suaedae TaxID=1686402 RepID=A0ABW5KDX5_9SPHI